MRKQKLLLLLCVMVLYVGPTSAMQTELDDLTFSLNILGDALRGELPPPPPPRDIDVAMPDVAIQLPPPPVPGGPQKPIFTGPLPPPPPIVPSQQQTVQPGAPLPPPPPATTGTTPQKPSTGLGDITNVTLKPTDKQKPVVPMGGGLMPTAEQLAQQRREREERLAAAKKRKETSGPIIDSFIKPTDAFLSYPAQATTPHPITSKEFGVEKEAVNAINIKAIWNPLERNLFTQDDKRLKQPTAKKILNGLLFFVRNNVVQPEQIKEIAALVLLILNIDPLLLNTATGVLYELGFTQEAIHRVMTLFFEERIRFIEETLEELKKQANEGAVQDIDEAFAYSIALSTEIARQQSIELDEHSSLAQKQQAVDFVAKVKALRKKLCDVLMQPDNFKLFNKKPVQALYEMICGQQQKSQLRVYCVSASYTYGASLEGKVENRDYTYCDFDKEIKRIMEEIDRFRQLKDVSVSQRVYTVQTIVSSLEDINTFFTNPDVCPNCLRRAIVSGHPGTRESREVAEPFKSQLAEIGDFLLAINKKDNSFYLEEFVRVGIPKIKQTLDRVRRYNDEESQIIYQLIGVNRERRRIGQPPITLEQYRSQIHF